MPNIRTPVKPVEYADDMAKKYSILGASLSLMSVLPIPIVQNISHSLLPCVASGLGWNGIDCGYGVLFGYHMIEKARMSAINQSTRKLMGSANMFWFGAGIPALTLWGFVSMMKQAVHTTHAKTIFMAGATGSASIALAASSFAFAIGMFIMAGNSAYKWYRAEKKLNPVYLLIDRLKKLEVLNQKSGPSEKEKQLLEKTAEQATALYQHCNDKFIALSGEIRQQCDPFRGNLVSPALANSLLEKQKKKIAESKVDVIANVAGGIAAVFAGLAILSVAFFPPATIILGVLSAAFFGISATIKAGQLIDRREQSKKPERSKTDDQPATASTTKSAL